MKKKMSFKVIITRDFDQMSETAAAIVAGDIAGKLETGKDYRLGLADGST